MADGRISHKPRSFWTRPPSRYPDPGKRAKMDVGRMRLGRERFRIIIICLTSYESCFMPRKGNPTGNPVPHFPAPAQTMQAQAQPRFTYGPERTPVASCITNLSPPIQCIESKDPVLTKRNEKRTNYWLGNLSLFPWGGTWHRTFAEAILDVRQARRPSLFLRKGH